MAAVGDGAAGGRYSVPPQQSTFSSSRLQMKTHRYTQRFTERIAFNMCSILVPAQSIAYLDLKPENILFARDGRVRLTDFGSALSGMCVLTVVAETLVSPRALLTVSFVLRVQERAMSLLLPQQCR